MIIDDVRSWARSRYRNRIKEIRQDAGLNQRQFADLVGIAEVRVNRLEKQTDFLSSWSMLAIRDGLQSIGRSISLDDFFEQQNGQGPA